MGRQGRCGDGGRKHPARRSGRPLSSPMLDSMSSLKKITKVAWLRHQIVTASVCHICDSSFETDDLQDINFSD
jgi:hypothetical protein